MVAVNLIILSLCQFQKINLLYKIQKNTEYSVICLHCIVVFVFRLNGTACTL